MEQNSKVAIVMSTYNGEKYIKEQLDSLLNQTYNNIDIYIRDDGSKDNTVTILKDYAEKNKNIFIFAGENLGYAKSFYKVLESAKDYDYYAFCDQDDKWHSNKIENAIKKINSDKPTCLFTEYNICDEQLKFIETSKLNKGGISFRNSLVEASISGNTTVFNKEMVKEFLKVNVDSVCCHDWLLYMIATGFGDIVYDSNPSLEYRRTGGNASPRGIGIVKLTIYRIKKFLFGDYLKGLKLQTIEFDKLFHDRLSDENKKIISLFTNKRYNFIIALKKVFYPKKFRQTLLDEILIRFMFLIGKL